MHFGDALMSVQHRGWIVSIASPDRNQSLAPLRRPGV